MAIEKRIKYQDGGNGAAALDPLEIIVFLMGKRASPGGLSYAEEKELDRLIKKTGYMSQKKAKGGKIEKPLPKPTYLNGNVIDLHPYLNDPYWEIETPTSNDDEASAPNGPPFMWEEFLQEKRKGYKGTYQDYLDVIDRSPLDYAKKREGIMRVASLEEDMDRDFYGRLLSPIYKKDYLENLPINELKELFDQYLRDMSIG